MTHQFSSSAKPNPGQFPKGRSGNPKGRPTGSRPSKECSALDIVLGKTLTLSLPGGGTREITLAEALQQQTFQKALKGERKAEREVLKWIRKREHWLAKNAPAPWPKIIRKISPDPDNADAALQLLEIAASNPARANVVGNRAQLLLEPWAAQAALSRRRGGSRLTDEDRDWIRRCTRDPDSLVWPRGTGE